jgi:hypothetical protein
MVIGFRPGLKFTRLMMVIGSFWPLFLLWAVRGSKVLDDCILFSICAALIIFPNLFLLWRIHKSIKQQDTRVITVENPEDHRDHILIYLFAILLPIYSLNLDSFRDSVVVIVALVLILFIFWIMDLHYMNLFFSIWGYSIFTINPEQKDDQIRKSFVLITKKSVLNSGKNITAHRISDTVFIEL